MHRGAMMPIVRRAMGTAQLQNSFCRMTLVFDREAGFLTAKADRPLANAAHAPSRYSCR
jgi:hypothetical protein